MQWFTHELSEKLQEINVAWAMARRTDSTSDWQPFRDLRNLTVFTLLDFFKNVLCYSLILKYFRLH